MCLIAIALHAHPDFPLVLAGNRDERHDRPAAPAHWWPDAPGVLGGRDLVADGSWLAVDRRGRFAVVTNQPRGPAPSRPAGSRGHLVRDFVAGPLDARAYLASTAARAPALAGFCLAAGDTAGILVAHNGEPDSLRGAPLEPGITTLSNAAPGQRWPKAGFLARVLRRGLETPAGPDAGELLRALARTAPVPGDALDGTPEFSRTPFVRGRDYGTRASTVVVFGRGGHAQFIERRFGPDGEPAGETSFDFAWSRG